MIEQDLITIEYLRGRQKKQKAIKKNLEQTHVKK